MKSSDTKIIASFAILILLSGCFVFEDDKPNKGKEMGYNLYFYGVVMGCARQYPDLCNDKYWTPLGGGNLFSGAIELQNSQGKTCGGMINGNGLQIYKSDGTKIKTSSIAEIIPLQCKHLVGNKMEDSKYSWYKLEKENMKKGILIFNHTIIRDSNGNPISVDNFSQYQSGDSLLCCEERSASYNCSGGVYAEFTCEKLNVQ